jgi:hypothetical protein
LLLFSIDILLFLLFLLHTLRSTTFLLFDLGHWYLAYTFINLFEFTAHGYFLPVILIFDPKVKLQTIIWKYRVLLIAFLSLGLVFKFILYRYMYIMYNVINRICLLDLEHYFFPFKINHNCLLETLETYYLLFASLRRNYFF